MKNQSLLIATIVATIAVTLIGSAIVPARARGTWVNKTCQKIAPPPSQSSNGFEIDYQFAFKTQQQPYLMYAARANDGAYLFCRSKPGRSPQVIKHEKLNFPFVETITQPKKGTPIFSVMIRDGNGRDSKVIPMRLDLKNPQRPIVIPE